MKEIVNKPLPEPAEFLALPDAEKLEVHLRAAIDYNNLAFLTNSLAHQLQEFTFAATAARVEAAQAKLAVQPEAVAFTQSTGSGL